MPRDAEPPPTAPRAVYPVQLDQTFRLLCGAPGHSAGPAPRHPGEVICEREVKGQGLSSREVEGQRRWCKPISPSHSSSCMLSGSVPVSLPDGVSSASRLMSSDGVSSGVGESATKPSLLGSWESLRLSVRLRDGAVRRFLAPVPTVPDRERLVGGANGRDGTIGAEI